jgi:hypothetical protein
MNQSLQAASLYYTDLRLGQIMYAKSLKAQAGKSSAGYFSFLLKSAPKLLGQNVIALIAEKLATSFYQS